MVTVACISTSLNSFSNELLERAPGLGPKVWLIWRAAHRKRTSWAYAQPYGSFQAGRLVPLPLLAGGRYHAGVAPPTVPGGHAGSGAPAVSRTMSSCLRLSHQSCWTVYCGSGPGSAVLMKHSFPATPSPCMSSTHSPAFQRVAQGDIGVGPGAVVPLCREIDISALPPGSAVTIELTGGRVARHLYARGLCPAMSGNRISALPPGAMNFRALRLANRRAFASQRSDDRCKW